VAKSQYGGVATVTLPAEIDMANANDVYVRQTLRRNDSWHQHSGCRLAANNFLRLKRTPGYGSRPHVRD
jgi:hypothetical protein